MVFIEVRRGKGKRDIFGVVLVMVYMVFLDNKSGVKCPSSFISYLKQNGDYMCKRIPFLHRKTKGGTNGRLLPLLKEESDQQL